MNAAIERNAFLESELDEKVHNQNQTTSSAFHLLTMMKIENGNFSHTLCNSSTISSCPEYLYPLDQIGHCLAGKLEDGGAEVEGRDKRPEIRVESPQPSSGEENGFLFQMTLFTSLQSEDEEPDNDRQMEELQQDSNKKVGVVEMFVNNTEDDHGG